MTLALCLAIMLGTMLGAMLYGRRQARQASMSEWALRCPLPS